MVAVHAPVSVLSELVPAAKLLDALPDPVLACDRRTRILHWNEAARRLYGYERHEALGRGAFTLLATRAGRPLFEIEEELADVGAWSGELVHRARDGTSIRVESRWLALRDERRGLVASVRIERLADSGPRVPPAGRDVGAAAIEPPPPFASRALHELNNALAIVLNYAAFVAADLERLQRDCGQERLAAVRRDLQEVQAAAERASTVLAGLVSGARGSAAEGRGA